MTRTPGHIGHDVERCKCQSCASRRSYLRHRARLLAEQKASRAAVAAGAEPAKHGITGCRMGCRCEVCVRAGQAYEAERYRSDPEHGRERVRQYREKNPDKVSSYRRQYYRDNRERISEYDRRRNAARAITRRASTAEWRRKNPDKVKLQKILRKDRMQAAAGKCSVDQLSARWAYYAGRCWMCGAVANQVDHVIPISRGGTNWPANLRPACGPCNQAKSAKLPSEMAI